MSKTFLLTAVAILTITLTATIILAATPVKQVSLQGRLSDPTGKPLDGTLSVKFEIFASATEGATGTGLWSEAQKVTVTKGLFGVNLGSVTQGGIPLAFDRPYWVEVTIGSEKLSPRYPLTSAPYSFYGGVAGNIDASKIIGTLNANQIPALTADKIPGLDAGKIISGTLSAARIPALTAAQIPALDAGKIATGTLNADRIPMLDASKKIADYSITSFQIDHTNGLEAEILFRGWLNPARIPSLYKTSWTGEGKGRIDASFIGTGTYNNWVAGMPASVITGTLDAARLPALTTSMIPGLDASKIISGTFAAARIPSITNTMIADNAVTSAKVATGSITTEKIADRNITTDKLYGWSVTETKIHDAAVVESKIADNAVTSTKVKDGTIVAADISDSAITNAKLAKHYLAGESTYKGKGLKIAQDIDNLGIRSESASCTCTVPDYAFTCNCWVLQVGPDEISVYAYAFDKDAKDMGGNLIDWIVVER